MRCCPHCAADSPAPARPLPGAAGCPLFPAAFSTNACRLYELFDLRRAGGAWHAGSGATWVLRSTRLRPRGWTSADAAGLPILPLLARADEVRGGRIDHALRVTAQRTRDAYVYPARHAASSLTSRTLPRMGERLRLKRGVDISHFPRQARIVLRAMRRYGLIVADNDQLRTLGRLTGRDFEVVDASSLR